MSLNEALRQAARAGDVAEAAQSLAEGANVNDEDDDGWTPLHHAARGGSEAAARLLLECGAAVDARDRYGRTPLCIAAGYDGDAVMRLLLDQGAAVAAADKNGWTPLHHAARSGSAVAARLLLDSGAAVDALDNGRRTPLSIAAAHDGVEVTRLLLDRGAAVEAADIDGRTPLYIAAGYGRGEAVMRQLLDSGAAVDAANKDGRTPLHTAAGYGHVRATRVLLKRGAAVDAADQNGQTPLHAAAKYGHEETGALLLAHGAAVDVIDRNSKTPQQVALAVGHAAMAAMLSRWAPGPRLQTAAGWAHSDAAAHEDHLGVLPAAQGTAAFLMHPKTSATAFAVYGRWGQGKSTFMKLVEQEMTYQAAWAVVHSWSHEQGMIYDMLGGRTLPCASPVELGHARKELEYLYDDLGGSDEGKRDEVQKLLESIVRPRLMCVWFNAWQYLTEEQVWAGLIVEVVKNLEEKLPSVRRRLLAWQYNMSVRGREVLMQLVLPVALTMLLVVPLTVFGVFQLQACFGGATQYTCVSGITLTGSSGGNQPASSTAGRAGGPASLPAPPPVPSPAPGGDSTDPPTTAMANWLSALVGVVGSFLLFVVLWNRVNAVIKTAGDTLMEKLKYVSLPDHSGRLGFQHEVIRDLKALRRLLPAGPRSMLGGIQQLKAVWRQRCRGLWRSLRGCCGLWQGCVACCGVLVCADARTGRSKMLGRVRRRSDVENADEKAEDMVVGPRIVVFIDDLDRVQPSKVVEVLEAINLVLNGSGFSVVIGMDKPVIHEALKATYKENKALQSAEQAEVFLEKIVHVSLSLPDPDKDSLISYFEKMGFLDTPATRVAREQRRMQASSLARPPWEPEAPGSSADPGATDDAGAAAGTGAAVVADAATGRGGAAGLGVVADPAAVAIPAAAADPGAGPGPGSAPLALTRPVRKPYRGDDDQGKDEYSAKERTALATLLREELVSEVSPREGKRFVNHFRLAKHILRAQLHAKQEVASEGDITHLLGWVFLWCFFPRGMDALMQYERQHRDGGATPHDPTLRELAEKAVQLIPSDPPTTGSASGAPPTAGVAHHQQQPQPGPKWLPRGRKAREKVVKQLRHVQERTALGDLKDCLDIPYSCTQCFLGLRIGMEFARGAAVEDDEEEERKGDSAKT